SQLRRHGGERFLAGGERRRNVPREIGTAERRALDQAHEFPVRVEEIEVIPDGAGEDLLRRAAAGERAVPPRAHGRAHILEATVEHCLVEIRLGAEEVAGRSPGHARERTYIVQTGGLVAPLGEEPLGGVEDGGAGACGIAFTVERGHLSHLLDVQQVYREPYPGARRAHTGRPSGGTALDVGREGASFKGIRTTSSRHDESREAPVRRSLCWR